jgi:hypothetical protein
MLQALHEFLWVNSSKPRINGAKYWISSRKHYLYRCLTDWIYDRIIVTVYIGLRASLPDGRGIGIRVE